MSQPNWDASLIEAHREAKRLFAVLLTMLAVKDDNEELIRSKAALLDAIKNSKTSNKQELGSFVRSTTRYMASHVYEKSGINELFVEGLVSEIKKRGTMYGLIDLLP